MECFDKFTEEEQEVLLDLVCAYINEYVFESTSKKHKQLLLSILQKMGVNDEYYTKILGGENNG